MSRGIMGLVRFVTQNNGAGGMVGSVELRRPPAAPAKVVSVEQLMLNGGKQ